MLAILITGFICVRYRPKPLPSRPKGNIICFQSFNDDDWIDRWLVTNARNYTGEWQVNTSIAPQAITGEKMLYMNTRKAFHGISSKLDKPFSITNETLIVQYEVRYQENIECAGAYIKLFDPNFDPEALTNETRFLLMFGPDHCDHFDRVHLIINYKNPISGKYEKKSLKEPPGTKLDKLTNLYTLIIRPDNTFEIRINNKKAKKGNLLTDLTPPINPPRTIDDPRDQKPPNWIDDPLMDDPKYPKPIDWDENAPEYIDDPNRLNPPNGWLVNEKELIPDPNEVKPKGWDDKKKGPWKQPTMPNPKCIIAVGCGPYSPPKIKNPKYRGKWIPPRIPNIEYKGEWKARQIENPLFYKNEHPNRIGTVSALGFELWTVHKGFGFDNILISTDEFEVKKWNMEHFVPKHNLQEERIFGGIDKSQKKKVNVRGVGFLKGTVSFIFSLIDDFVDLIKQSRHATTLQTLGALFTTVFVLYFVFFRKKSRKDRISPEKKKKIMRILLQREMEKKKMDSFAQRKENDIEILSNQKLPTETGVIRRNIRKTD